MQINSPQNEEEKLKAWDVFITLPPPDDDETLDSEYIDLFIKFLKILAYLVVFGVVLFCATFSKSVILLGTSMIKVNRSIPICNHDRGVEQFAEFDRTRRYVAFIGEEDLERIVWIWCLLFMIMSADVWTFGRSLRICVFKNYKVPKLTTFLMVSSVRIFFYSTEDLTPNYISRFL